MNSSIEYRKGYSDGEIDGSKHVIREIYSAINHLNPPDTGVGVAELIAWALDRQWAAVDAVLVEAEMNTHAMDPASPRVWVADVRAAYRSATRNGEPA